MAYGQINAGGAFLVLRIDDTLLNAGLKAAEERLKQFGSRIRQIGTELALAGTAIGSVFVALPVKLAANLEVAEAAFGALIGNTERAKELIQDLIEFSGRSPVNFESLQNAARTMLNFGINVERVAPVLEQLTAITGGNVDAIDRLAVAFGQTQSKGRLMAEEVRQMVNAGFNPLQEIARTSGQSMNSLIAAMERGEISAGQVARAFESVTGPGGRFNGILEAIRKTATGAFRQTVNGLQSIGREIGKVFLPRIGEVLAAFNELMPQIQQFVAENEKLVLSIGITIGAVTALGFAMVGLGTAIRLLTFSFTGLRLALIVLIRGLAVAGVAIKLFGVAMGFLLSNPYVIVIIAIAAAVSQLAFAFDEVGVGIDFAIARMVAFSEQSKKSLADSLNLLKQTEIATRPGGSGRTKRDHEAVALTAFSVEKAGLGNIIGSLLGNAAVATPIIALQRLRASRDAEAFKKGEDLDDEIAQARINAIKDEHQRRIAQIEFEIQQRAKQLQDEGLFNAANREKLAGLREELLAGAANLASKGPDAIARSTFGSKFAQQALGISGGKSPEVTELQKIRDLLKNVADFVAQGKWQQAQKLLWGNK